MPPRPAGAVRGLWESASPEAREKAHRAASAILESWVGLKTREQVSVELWLPPLRIWQLSQQALSGMVAGLLKQPRGRKGIVMDPEEDPKVLRKRIRELELDLSAAKKLIEILKDLPENRPQIVEVPRRGKGGGKKTKADPLPGGIPPAGGSGTPTAQ